jgi:hypothetical protein
MSAHGHTFQPSDRQLGTLGPILVRAGLIVGGIGLGASLILGFAMGNGERFFKSYLVAFMVVLSIALGGLFFTILHHLVKAGWSVVVRRISEGVASTLRYAWIFFIPILVGMLIGSMYSHWADISHWADPSHFDEVIAGKAIYFFFGTPEFEQNTLPWFWIIRAVIFLAVWAMLARYFVNASIAQDASGDVNISRRLQQYAPVAMILYALTQTFAAFDWLMSLEPHWFSTMFPVYFFAASCTGFFAFLILCMFYLQKKNKLTSELTAEHFQDAGKLLFAFGIVFWAYIAYSQYMLLWYANIPETSGWVITRQIHGWGPVSLFLLFGHFIGPFLIIISRHMKRAKTILAAVAGWMLLMHFIDIYWLAMPIIPHDELYVAASYGELVETTSNEAVGYGWHLLDFTCLIGMAGLLVAGTAHRLSSCALIPEQDPRLNESLAFQNM